ncbi:MAG: hypothetical protein IJQ24_02705, partial [Synergistaceae bacterium]|nr:hypothetical protein [Synergistaceae bacterium]
GGLIPQAVILNSQISAFYEEEVEGGSFPALCNAIAARCLRLRIETADEEERDFLNTMFDHFCQPTGAGQHLIDEILDVYSAQLKDIKNMFHFWNVPSID